MASSARRIGRWVVFALAAVVFVFVMRAVLFPYPDQPYQEVPHGDHVHYVPKDRDRNVPISNYPTVRPGPDEVILPGGEVVPKSER